jgi:hypothetical protein
VKIRVLQQGGSAAGRAADGEWWRWLHALGEVEDNGKCIFYSHFRVEEIASECHKVGGPAALLGQVGDWADKLGWAVTAGWY